MQRPTTPRWRSAYSCSSPHRCISPLVWYQTIIRELQHLTPLRRLTDRHLFFRRAHELASGIGDSGDASSISTRRWPTREWLTIKATSRVEKRMPSAHGSTASGEPAYGLKTPRETNHRSIASVFNTLDHQPGGAAPKTAEFRENSPNAKRSRILLENQCRGG